jgi:hypothetical protein
LWSRNIPSELPESAAISMAGAAGIEPATYGFGDRRSTS